MLAQKIRNECGVQKAVALIDRLLASRKKRGTDNSRENDVPLRHCRDMERRFPRRLESN